MLAYYVSIAFVFGTIYGSFLNVLLWRLPEGKGIGGRSNCRSCGHQLAWHDLVPIASFFWLKGQCRYCRASISARYPIVEAAVGTVLGLLVAFVPSVGLQSAFDIAAALILISLFFFDLYYFILPNAIVYPAVAIFAVYDGFFRPDWLILFITALSLGAFFVILYLVSKGAWLGFGDVKLAILVGLILGWPLSFLATVLGIWAGALTGIFLLLVGRAGRKDALPFGSFWTAAAIFSIIFQHALYQTFTIFFR